MKTQSNIPIPSMQLWKEGQWVIAVNHVDNGLQAEGDEGKRYEADFTIVDAQTAEAAIHAFTRMTVDVPLDESVIYNFEVNGRPAIKTKPDYPVPVEPTIFPPLPEQGWLEVGHIYSYADGAVMVVQSHNRTIYAPENTPALFSFYRPNTPELLWIPNEQVQIGWKRWFNDKQYDCIKSHMTLSTWTPDVTPALWVEIQQQGEKPPQWVSANWAQYTPIGYEVFDLGKVWRVKTLSHTWIQPALTENGAISWTFVKDWID